MAETQGKSQTAQRFAGTLVLLCSAVFMALLLHNHYLVLGYPHPLDYNEASVATVTALLMEGGNPYALAAQPAETSVYPIAINLLVAPLANLFGNTLVLHRFVSMVFILLAAGLVGLAVRRLSGSTGRAFVAGALAYAAFLYYSTPISGPNGLGIFLFLATVYVPWLRDFSRPSLVASILLGVLAFYTKQYFVAGLGYVALYLFLARSKRDGVLFGVAFVAALVLSVPIVHLVAPYYFDSTLFPISSVTGTFGSLEVMLNQLRDYSKLVYPLYLVLVLSAVAAVRDRGTVGQADGKSDGLFNLRTLDAPLLTRPPDASVVYLLCSLVIFVFALGTNPGNYLSYLFQLVSPFLVVVALGLMPREGVLGTACLLLLLPAMYHGYTMQSRDLKPQFEDNWADLTRVIQEADHVFASNILLAEVVASDKAVYQNGHTPYIYFGRFKPELFRRENYEESVAGLWDRYADEIHGMIREQRFDVFLINFWTSIPSTAPDVANPVDGRELLTQYYKRERVVKIAAANRPGGGTFPIEIWRPRAKPAEAPVRKKQSAGDLSRGSVN